MLLTFELPCHWAGTPGDTFLLHFHPAVISTYPHHLGING